MDTDINKLEAGGNELETDCRELEIGGNEATTDGNIKGSEVGMDTTVDVVLTEFNSVGALEETYLIKVYYVSKSNLNFDIYFEDGKQALAEQ